MKTSGRRLRVVQWTTGNVAKQSLRAILSRGDLELVGLYAYSKDKVGKDAGELVGLTAQTGVYATDSLEQILALKPDCIAYTPLRYDVEHMEAILRSGVNIVTTTGNFISERVYGRDVLKRLEAAAQEGGASLFGTGMHPGWCDGMLVSASGLCKKVHLLRAIESVNLGAFAADSNQDSLGWGRPPNDPGHKEDIMEGQKLFIDAVETVAHDLGFELDDVRCNIEFAYATEDLAIPGRDVKKGTVAGLLCKWQGVAKGSVVIELISNWVLASEIEPAWNVEMAYFLELEGNPGLKVRIDILPDDANSDGMDSLQATGMIMTASPAVNAIPAVVHARPGIVTFKDIPAPVSVLHINADLAAKSRYAPALAIEEKIPMSMPQAAQVADLPGMRGALVRCLESFASRLRGEPEVIPAGTPGKFEGHWKIVIKTPGNPTESRLLVEKDGGTYRGMQSGEGSNEPIIDVRLDGGVVEWTAKITKPIKLTCVFRGSVVGDQIIGKVKAGFFGSFPFSGERVGPLH